ncbi:MAG: hypothetical protein AB1651_05480 [Pseudomonadota bacterium]
MSHRQLTPAALMAKADTACSSARALLDLGDVDGAANRAYYAMFDAAAPHYWRRVRRSSRILGALIAA